jgi:hypothetical protein
METTLDGTTSVVRAEQKANASGAIVITLIGSVIVARAEQEANAAVPILATLASPVKVTVVRFLLLVNA